MARIKSSEKRSAILQAAVREIAEVGLGAPTAKIARRAGLAAGTRFTYFANRPKNRIVSGVDGASSFATQRLATKGLSGPLGTMHSIRLSVQQAEGAMKGRN
jgi:hypothetical protein